MFLFLIVSQHVSVNINWADFTWISAGINPTKHMTKSEFMFPSDTIYTSCIILVHSLNHTNAPIMLITPWQTSPLCKINMEPDRTGVCAWFNIFILFLHLCVQLSPSACVPFLCLCVYLCVLLWETDVQCWQNTHLHVGTQTDWLFWQTFELSHKQICHGNTDRQIHK